MDACEQHYCISPGQDGGNPLSQALALANLQLHKGQQEQKMLGPVTLPTVIGAPQ